MAQSQTMTETVWQELISWLGAEAKVRLDDHSNGNRRLLATENINHSTPIIQLTPDSLLNTNSLSQIEDQNQNENQIEHQSLTSTQRLTLYLTQSRSTPSASHHLTQSRSTPHHFKPYLTTLPQSFPSVPLVWFFHHHFDSSLHNLSHLPTTLLLDHQYTNPPFYDLITPTTIAQIHQVTTRFLEDWQALLPLLLPHLLLEDLLWAWLVVNTRSVWYDLGLKNHADNITLAPVFDMANHAAVSAVTAIRTPHTLTMYSSYPRGTFSSPTTGQPIKSSRLGAVFNLHQPPTDAGIAIKKGEEIRFCYGPHSNATLLAEYGFVLMSDPDHPGRPNPWDAIDLSIDIEGLFQHFPDKISLLKDTGYWGDYSVQSGEPIEGAYRTLVALRLLHSPADGEARWQAHVAGETDELEPDIERAVWHTLHTILATQASRAHSLVARFLARLPHPPLDDYAFSCLKTLAEDELNALTRLAQQASCHLA